MHRAEDVTPGMLLVATHLLADPNFARSVVLLLDVNAEGALGVVLNRPSEVLVADVLEGWGPLCAPPEVLFSGGPVSRDGAVAVAMVRDPEQEPIGFRAISGQVGMLDLDTPIELLDGGLLGLRVFAGYAGWGAQQLRGEIDEGSWHVVPGEPSDAFRADPRWLWRDVLQRQPGQLAWHATRPTDPDLN
ncbi:YqgE/AlgH family protein [Nocardioides piscis]|uniref:YqgE/AlgH family protein n=1 Tax=Nocardioides piscis TaxID=2714938 RepID=A0A6G7YB83_9ACTN|nr:YqgE/AlgH family protein [Nocardioides piscis]QIK74082.1 YqgE/AlgH family protein [Nocardioides piscis]